MLCLLVSLPLVGSALLSVLWESAFSTAAIRQYTLAVTLATFTVSIAMWSQFDSCCFDPSFSTNMLSFELAIDGISLYFVLLSTFTIPLCLLAGWVSIDRQVKLFCTLLLALEGFLLCVFLVQDLILFYVFFEVVLIPLFIMVGVWGASGNRIRASFLLFLYTFLGSLFMLIAFITIIRHTGTGNLPILTSSCHQIDPVTQQWIWLGIFVSLAIKTPVVPFHIWLSRAHVEASIGVSMLLAGLILKLATYGFLRVLIPVLPEATAYMTPMVQTVAVLSLVYSSLTTLRQSDFKVLIAYSSVAHMAVVLLGLFSNELQSLEGAILMGIAHGFVSPALFLCVGGVLYDRYHTRVIRYYRGLTLVMPLFSAAFFLCILANMSTPLTVNWVAETLILLGSIPRSPLAVLVISSGIVLSAAYSIYLYARLATGDFSIYLAPEQDLNRREFMILLPLIAATFFLGIFPNIVLVDLHSAVSLILYS